MPLALTARAPLTVQMEIPQFHYDCTIRDPIGSQETADVYGQNVAGQSSMKVPCTYSGWTRPHPLIAGVQCTPSMLVPEVCELMTAQGDVITCAGSSQKHMPGVTRPESLNFGEKAAQPRRDSGEHSTAVVADSQGTY